MTTGFAAPNVEDMARAWCEGNDAARAGKKFKDACPYTYERFPGLSIAAFNLTKRPLMDEWLKAWRAYRDNSTRAA